MSALSDLIEPAVLPVQDAAPESAEPAVVIPLPEAVLDSVHSHLQPKRTSYKQFLGMVRRHISPRFMPTACGKDRRQEPLPVMHKHLDLVPGWPVFIGADNDGVYRLNKNEGFFLHVRYSEHQLVMNLKTLEVIWRRIAGPVNLQSNWALWKKEDAALEADRDYLEILLGGIAPLPTAQEKAAEAASTKDVKAKSPRAEPEEKGPMSTMRMCDIVKVIAHADDLAATFAGELSEISGQFTSHPVQQTPFRTSAEAVTILRRIHSAIQSYKKQITHWKTTVPAKHADVVVAIGNELGVQFDESKEPKFPTPEAQ